MPSNICITHLSRFVKGWPKTGRIVQFIKGLFAPQLPLALPQKANDLLIRRLEISFWLLYQQLHDTHCLGSIGFS